MSRRQTTDRGPKKKRQDRHGVAAAEVAILLPILVLLLFGGIEVGHYVNTAQLASDASRVGARKAARHDTTQTAEVTTVVENYLEDIGVPGSAIDVDVLDGNGSAIANGDLTGIASGDAVAVRVQVTFETVRGVPLLRLLDGAVNSTMTTARRE